MLILNRADVSGYITAQQRSSDINQAPEKLEATAEGIKFSPGDNVIDIQDGVMVFNGYVFESRESRSNGNSFTAYSVKKYLIKNYETGDFRNMTADALIKKLCSGCDIPTGEIQSTEITIPVLIFQEERLIYDMMLIALNETVKRGGDKFILEDKSGVIELRKKRENIISCVFEQRHNITDSESSYSIEDMFNAVKVISSGDKKLNAVIAKDDGMVERYGKMQKIESPSVQTKAEMQQVADSVLSEFAKVKFTGSVTVLDVPSLDAGKAIAVYDTATSLIGKYFVEAVTHNEKEKTMQITLTLTDSAPEIEYSPPTEKEPSSSKSDGKASGSTGSASARSNPSTESKNNNSVSKETWEQILNS